MTIQRQLTDPFAAFAFGRLGIRPVLPLVRGLPATLRGNLIHDALHELYRELPSQENIAILVNRGPGWPDAGDSQQSVREA